MRTTQVTRRKGGRLPNMRAPALKRAGAEAPAAEGSGYGRTARKMEEQAASCAAGCAAGAAEPARRGVLAALVAVRPATRRTPPPQLRVPVSPSTGARRSFEGLRGVVLHEVHSVFLLAHTDKRQGREKSAEELDGGVSDGVEEAGARVEGVREVDAITHGWVEVGAADVADGKAASDDHEADREAMNVPCLATAGQGSLAA